jgi:hypothetical protein
VSEAATTVSLALLSHTNVGKTTLARTLLRQDIGAVADRAHVTEVAESHVLMRSAAGDELLLWDTPGFGDSVRLLARLQGRSQPLGWFLSQVWDRYADRPFWCGQQAMRAARDSADVLLYVVNATEEPESAGYLEAELQIIAWIGKPALVLVNQLGTQGDAEREARIVDAWAAALRRLAPDATRVLSFDAFARCWVQEHVLLDAVGTCLPAGRTAGYARLAAAWRARDREVFERSAEVIARQLAATARDEQRAPERRSLVQKGMDALRSVAGSEADPGEQEAQRALLDRLDAEVRACTESLAALHGLTGSAGADIVQTLGHEFATVRPLDADQAGVWGGLLSGALAGLAADLAAGGLTFGAGALLGGIAGAFGARKLTQQYNAALGRDGAATVRWSEEFLEARLAAALMRYLAVAHFGRGRGSFAAGATPARWGAAVAAAVQRQATTRAGLWAEVRESREPAPARLQRIVGTLLQDALRELYPDAYHGLDRP